MKTINLDPFYKDGYIKQMPKKRELRILILQSICKELPLQEIYTETEINNFLKTRCDDFVEIRRYLIDYGILKRNRDGSAYYKCNEDEI